MKIGKILKISISAILSLALIASIIVIPAVSAETTTDYNLIKEIIETDYPALCSFL